ncbi:hypothetical protein [Dysgonomonas sp. Marseille-P4361]|uniref:hypothetical protein n=1 Tax=Dysgonomonas sp. Marseille-P4361 TaxID=2161820 RepID=UPI000D5627AC|nr:hypothetical protein [Dysgonomonas sp. Marseille-P4361]
MRNFLKALTISLFLFLPFSCGNEEEVNVLPEVPVNLKINLLVDDELRTPGNYKEYIKGVHKPLAGEYLGYGGILVLRSIHTGEEIPFRAFDLSCPYEKSPTIRVKASREKGVTATCQECGRIYNLLEDGRITSESSKLHLQRYNVKPSSDPNIFRITRDFY